jgi:hypothetical protein
MILVNVRHVVKDQQVVFVELADGGFELQRLASSLQFLDDVGGAGEEHAEAVLDERATDGRCTVALAGTGRSSVIVPSVWDQKCGSRSRGLE